MSDSLRSSLARPWYAAVLTLALAIGPLWGPDLAHAQAPADPVVAQGHYLALAGNCVSCHTHPGGQPFAGGLEFNTPFGTLYSTNITPDPTTGIGKWSEKDFVTALRTGVRPNGDHLYPAFPYTAFTKISDADAHALFVYLKSLPPVQSAAPDNKMRFPYSQRWMLGMWKMLFFTQGRYVPDNSQSAQWNRGAYLVQGLAHCDACHAARNFLGAEGSNPVMSGGEYTAPVSPDEQRTWSTPNLTPAHTGLQSWSTLDLASYLKTGRNPFTETFGPMNEVIMNSTRNLTDSDVQAMAAYIKSLPATATESDKPSADLIQSGETVYNVNCGTCHLPTGLGNQDENSGARLAGSPIVQASNPAALINVIIYGPQLPNPPLPKRWKPMDGFGDKLADDEIAALATYLRNTWGNTGSAVTTDQVAKQR